MTLEIYSYLLIRTYLIQDEIALTYQGVEDKREQFKYFIDSIAMVMENEDFIAINPKIQEDINRIIQESRFDFIGDKEINGQVNFIISRLNEYKLMSDKKKKWLAHDFYKDEYNDRLLPFKYRKYKYVEEFITYDYANLCAMIGPTKIEEFEGYYETDNAKVSVVISYLATINLIMSRAPETISDEEKYKIIANMCKILTTLQASKEEFKYMEKTAEHIGSLIEEKDEDEIEKLKRLIL